MYWYYLQSDWNFFQYLNQRDNGSAIQPLYDIPNFNGEELESPGQILRIHYIRPSGRSFNSFDEQFAVPKNTIHNIVHGKSRIGYLIAGKLATVFGTDAKYWLDVQTAYELKSMIRSKLINNTILRNSLLNYCSRITKKDRVRHLQSRNPLHPGQVLMEQFIKPSGIPCIDWQRMLCLSKKSFSSIINKKSELSLELLIKLSRVCGTKAHYWIEAQNCYLASKGEKKSATRKRKIKLIIPLKPLADKYPIHPSKVLVDKFIKPMGLARDKFTKHLGYSTDRLEQLQRGNSRISFELAIRMGEAFSIDPLFWVRLQLERDIYRYETRSVGLRKELK
jgi:addiction module HigA family antidote